MIVSFIATDIIIVNKSSCIDELKKILCITWNSLDKMNKLGLPKILKNIWTQIDVSDILTEFEEIMDSMDDSSEKWKEKGIIKFFLLEDYKKEEVKKVKCDILQVESYLEQAKTAFEQIQNLPKYKSVSALLSHIDNFNDTMNGKDTFKMDNIK